MICRYGNVGDVRVLILGSCEERIRKTVSNCVTTMLVLCFFHYWWHKLFRDL